MTADLERFTVVATISFVPVARRRRWPRALGEALRASRADVGRVWSLAWPVIAHMGLLTLVFVVDRLVLGRHSAGALASLQLSTTLAFGAYAILSAFSVGTLAVVARAVGRGDDGGAAIAARVSILAGFGLGVVVAIPLIAFRGPLLATLFAAVEPALRDDAAAYLGIVGAVLPLSLVEATAAAALQGAGDTRSPLRAAVVGNVVNLAVSPALVLGWAGLPSLGVRGAAWGTAAAIALQAALLVVAVARRWPSSRSARWRASEALDEVLAVGFPSLVERCVGQGGYVAYVAIIGLLGTTVMAANQALSCVEAVCFLSAEGFGVAAAAHVGQRLGAGRVADAGRAAWLATGMAVIALGAMSVVFSLFPRELVGAFAADEEVRALGEGTMAVVAISQPFVAVATVMAMALRGAGATRQALVVTFAGGGVVRLTATWLLAVELGWGLEGVFWGSTLDWMFRAVVATALLRALLRRPRDGAVMGLTTLRTVAPTLPPKDAAISCATCAGT